MRWFDRWFMRMSKRAWDLAREDGDMHNIYTSTGPRIVSAKESVDSRRKLNLSIMPATGGSILQINWYDERKDHHDSDLYIINDDEELAPQLASILMQHKMRH